VPGKQPLGKEFFKKKSFFFVECHAEGHSANKFSKKTFFFAECRMVSIRLSIFQKKSLPSAVQRDTRQRNFQKKKFVECRSGEHSAKIFFKKIFAECHAERHSVKKFSKKILCRVPYRETLGKVLKKHSTKPLPKVKWALPSAQSMCFQ
jgi:hypothetical protein